jgi:hypothetical protein
MLQSRHLAWPQAPGCRALLLMQAKVCASGQRLSLFAMRAHNSSVACFGRPELVEVAPGGQQVFDAQALRHPCAYMSRATSCFVPNDVRMGGGEPPFILLTGAPPAHQCCLPRALWGLQVPGGAADGVPAVHLARRGLSVSTQTWLRECPGVQAPTWAGSRLYCGRRASPRCWRRCDDQTASCLVAPAAMQQCAAHGLQQQHQHGSAGNCALVSTQVGAWVPATSFRLSPADAIFVRMVSASVYTAAALPKPCLSGRRLSQSRLSTCTRQPWLRPKIGLKLSG